MPNQDGTGPMGRGPVTGRGFGQCQGQRFRGMSRGMGLRRGNCGFWAQSNQPLDLEAEKELLKEELKAVEEEIKALRKK